VSARKHEGTRALAKLRVGWEDNIESTLKV
jgi:hypothetical protein